jgi:cob(I)alamin adenosyltransferase
MTNRRGLLVVHTGQGKGKTTAALGIAWRALGHGMRVAVVQFVKGRWETGERRFAVDVPNLEFLVTGRGFTWDSEDLSADRMAAVDAWRTAAHLIDDGEHDVVVLDELTYVLHYGWLSIADVRAALDARPAHVHVIVTGRHAPPALLDAADLVTEMVAVKHPFARGVRAQAGIDF